MSEPSISIRRHPERGSDARADLEGVLDEALVAHVGYIRDGHPVVIPTLFARTGGKLLLHGSPAAGYMRAARDGQTLCVTVTVIDGLVLARAAFHHSANYRSAVVFGTAERLTDEEKWEALDAFVDKLVPGRRPHLRAMLPAEVRQTEIVAIPLDRASVKIRTGGPVDDQADLDLGIWAGVLPIETRFGQPVSAPDLGPDVSLPDHLRALIR